MNLCVGGYTFSSLTTGETDYLLIILIRLHHFFLIWVHLERDLSIINTNYLHILLDEVNYILFTPDNLPDVVLRVRDRNP